MAGATGQRAGAGRESSSDRTSAIRWIATAAALVLLVMVALWAVSRDQDDTGIDSGVTSDSSVPAGEIVDGESDGSGAADDEAPASQGGSGGGEEG